jgi:hypothetical protein
MNETKNTAKKVEAALGSLDGLQTASPGPFFFTRVQARLQKQSSSGWESVTSFITRPAIALSGLCIIIMLNAVAFYLRPESTGSATTVASEQGYADEYRGLATNFLYDENPEP